MPLPLLRHAALLLYQQTPVSRSRLSSIRLSIIAHSRITSSSTPTSRLHSTTKSTSTSPPRSGSDKKPLLDEQPAPPKAGFSNLGASKNVRLFVIAVLTVFATMESIFWIRVLWAKFGPIPKEEQTGESVDGKPA